MGLCESVAKKIIGHRLTQTDTDKGNMEINDMIYQINGAVFEVNRVLGACFFEKICSLSSCGSVCVCGKKK